jgi:hypothetical protein
MLHLAEAYRALTALKESSREPRKAPCCRLQQLPDLTMLSLARPCLAIPFHTTTTLQREQQRGPKPSVLPSATLTLPSPAAPRPALPYQTRTTLPREQQRGLTPSVLLSAVIALPHLASPMLAPPDPTPPDRALLGLTPKAAQLDQATSASMRLRVAVTGRTSASKRPCLGRQSPSPTSLPASLAISSTSRKFNTSGSY